MDLFLLIIIFFSLVIAGLLSTKALIHYSVKHSILDQANSRSSHTHPTPRIGGISFVVLMSLTLIVCFLFNVFNLSSKTYWALLIPSLLVASVSILDDVKGGISRLTRLAVHFIAATLATVLLGLFNSGSGSYLFAIMLIIGIVWITNLYNFMDGIDGIAGTQAIFILAASSGLSFKNQHTDWATIQLILAAPILGFQIPNWQPAKIFMGDIGSTYLGILLSCILLIDTCSGIMPLTSLIILMGTFLTDASWTLFYRLVTRQKWYHAHRSHTYQILSRKLNSHAKVSVGNALINLVWLLPLSYAAARYPASGYIFVAVALIPLVFLCFRAKAGKLLSN